MIKFFRKIRQNLISNGNSVKYLKYAIGEIVLVVIGILIALSINNFYEEIKDRETVRLYLKNFVADLKNDQKIMNTVIEAHSFRYHAMQYLLMQIGEDIYDPTRDEILMPVFVPNDIWKKEIPEDFNSEFVGLAYLWTHRSVSQNLTTATIDELKSTGIFSHINNYELKSAINGYYDYWSHRLGARNQSKFYTQVDQWETSLGQDGLFTNGFYDLKDPLAIIRNNQERIFILKKLVREAAWIVEIANGVNDYSEALINYIEDNYLEEED